METDRTKRFERLGAIARRVAGKLIAAREFQEKDAASAPEGSTRGASAQPREETPCVMVGGKSASTAGGDVAVDASADRGEVALIGGPEAHTDFEIQIAGMGPARGRRDSSPARSGGLEPLLA